MSRYIRIGGWRRQPPGKHSTAKQREREGKEGVGKNCIVCGNWTLGQLWIEVSFMRGEDELVYCCQSCKKSPESVIAAFTAPTGR